MYEAEVWNIKNLKLQQGLITEIDFLWSNYRNSRLKSVRNNVIKDTVNITHQSTERTEQKYLMWFCYIKHKGKENNHEVLNSNGIKKKTNIKECMCYNRNRWKLGSEKLRLQKLCRHSLLSTSDNYSFY